MVSRQHENTGARRAALQALYSGHIAGARASALIDEGLFLEDEEKLSAYAIKLVQGVEGKTREVDALLDDASDNWALDRMPIVDLTILRLAVYEMLFEDGVPLSVSINEAVELAKSFGGEDDSPRFVNGVLGRIAKTVEELGVEAAVAETLERHPEPAEEPEAAEAGEAAEAADADEAAGEEPAAVAGEEAAAEAAAAADEAAEAAAEPAAAAAAEPAAEEAPEATDEQ